MCFLQSHMKILWRFLHWKYSKSTKKTLRRCEPKGNVWEEFSLFPWYLLEQFYTKTDPTTMWWEYIFHNTFYGKPYWFNKTFGKSACTSCMKENIEIIDNSKQRFSQLINACLEVYSGEISVFSTWFGLRKFGRLGLGSKR